MPVIGDELVRFEEKHLTRAQGIEEKSDSGNRKGFSLPLLFSQKGSWLFILNQSCSDVQCFIVKPVMNLPPHYKDKPVPEQILK